MCAMLDIGLIHKLWEGWIYRRWGSLCLQLDSEVQDDRRGTEHSPLGVRWWDHRLLKIHSYQVLFHFFEWFWCVEVTEVTEVNEHDPTPFWFSAIVSQWVRTTWRPSVRRKFRSSEENSRASSCRSGQFSTTRSRCRQTQLAGKSLN